MALGTLTNLRQAMAGAAESVEETAEWMWKAARSIDEGVGEFEAVGATYWLLQAYPHGCRVHLPLAAAGGQESLEKLREYAGKAAELLAAFGRHAEAEGFAELADRLDEQGAAALRGDHE